MMEKRNTSNKNAPCIEIGSKNINITTKYKSVTRDRNSNRNSIKSGIRENRGIK
jgi:hypothetical protein